MTEQNYINWRFLPLGLLLLGPLGTMASTSANIVGRKMSFLNHKQDHPTLRAPPAPPARSAVTHYKTDTSSSANHQDHRKMLIEEEEYPRKFSILEAKIINEKVVQLGEQYPDWIKVTTSQEAYGLPRAGNQKDCLFDKGGAGCLNYILTIQDFTLYPEGSEGSNKLPEVFWSGALHGNERVGPTSVTEAITLLVEAVHCESLPSVQPRDPLYSDQFQQAIKCRNLFQSHGITDAQRQWLARLVRSRRLIVMPTTNALGYARNRREENQIDPNRDFPYDLTDPTICMQTIAGRSVNEVYREHMFQLALTFHGGTEVIGYEWGAPTYVDEDSPDDFAQEQIAKAYSQYAGSFPSTRAYKYGDMNTEVYFVRGGMEDWAYAGSWDPDRVIQCEPTTYGGYPKEKTVYDNSTLRVYNMLVETSNNKTPPQNALGTTESVLTEGTKGNGHISRNIRLALLSLELVEPYVHMVGVQDLTLHDTVFQQPKADNGDDDDSCFGSTIMIAKSIDSLSLEWTVGGALEVAETKIFAAPFENVKDELSDCSGSSHWPLPTHADFKEHPVLETVSHGTTQWHSNGTFPTTDDTPKSKMGPLFRATLDTKSFVKGDKIVVVATARVDPSWGDPKKGAKPKGLGPQAHIANVRTSDNYKHQSGANVIQGQTQWASRPILVVVGDYEEGDVGRHESGHVGSVFEMTNRFGKTTGDGGGVLPSRSGSSKGFFGASPLWIAALVILLFAIVGIWIIRRREYAYQKQVQDDLYYEEDMAFSSSRYKDDSYDSDEEQTDQGSDDEEGQPQRGGHSVQRRVGGGNVEMKQYSNGGSSSDDEDRLSDKRID